jgi:phosphoribosylformylglycinamidine cyclo-ligase
MARKKTEGLTYARSGVDVDAGDALVQHIRKRVPSIGGFSGLFPIRVGGRKTNLVGTTDGVGTKLKLAFLLGKHDTVGVDLVAMCVNDLICAGATPLFFLDYFATGKLKLSVATAVVDGILDGCQQGGLALLGGETAEMPGFYPPGEYDLAGFAVGMVSDEDTLDGRRARPGDLLCALPSSGVHSNGFSLVRKAFSAAELKRRGRALLTPTRIYVEDVKRLRKAVGQDLKALAHITGEGLEGNVPRVLPKGLTALIRRADVKTPAIFRAIQKAGGVEEDEMWRTFNMGVGMVAVLSPAALRKAQRACPELYVVGSLKRGKTDFAWEN